jgi:hypothetical protein
MIVEDLAYCLMGIFGVHMPLLYGEGQNAFIRLQEEIMKVSDDQTIFSWGFVPSVRSDEHGYSPQLLINMSIGIATCRFCTLR